MKTDADQAHVPKDAKLKRTGLAGIAIGAIALLACEVPIILAVLGLGGLSASAAFFRPPAMVELGAIVIAVVGTFLLMIVFARRLFGRRRRSSG